MLLTIAAPPETSGWPHFPRLDFTEPFAQFSEVSKKLRLREGESSVPSHAARQWQG